jgi:integrase
MTAPGLTHDAISPQRATSAETGLANPALGEARCQPMPPRPYGSGRLFARRDRRGRESWYGSWWVGSRRVKRSIGPKRTEGTHEGLTRAQAEAQLRRLMSETVVASTGGAVSLAEGGERYLAHLANVLERKPTTTQDYRIMLDRHLLRFFGDVRLSAISAEKVAAFINSQRRAGLAANTVRNHVNFLHGLLGFAVKRGWIGVNPVDQVDKPRQARNREQRIQFLSPPEVEALIRAVPDDVLGEVEPPLYLTAALTGLRIGELLALRWRDVDWVAGRIRVAESYTRGTFGSPKSARGVRSVPLADRLAGELERHFQASAYQGDDDLVFCHPRIGSVLDPSKLRKRFVRALAAARLRPIRFHDSAIRSAPRWPRPARLCERSRSGWATRTTRRPRSTPTTRLTRRTARHSWSGRSAFSATPRLHQNGLAPRPIRASGPDTRAASRVPLPRSTLESRRSP